MATTRRVRPRKAAKPATASRKVRRRASRSEDAEEGAGIVGAAGFAAAKKQQKRQQEEFERMRAKPFAFRITQSDMSKGKGKADLLYLDKEPFFIRLHTIKNSRGGFDDVVCIADTGENCPICRETGKEGTYTLTLTALDKRPYRTREGKLIKISKKLVAVKSRNIAKFERQWKKHGNTFRGLTATHRRAGAKEAAIGEDIEFNDKLVSERIIQKTCKGDEELMTPPNYSEIFPTMTADELEERFGGMGSGGGGGGRRRNTDDDDDDEGIAWG